MKEKKKGVKARHKRRRIDFSFSHIKVAGIITILAAGTLIGAVYLNCVRSAFWSSILANIFAGLITGLILCVISGTKQRTIASLKNELSFLNGLQKELAEYINYYGKMRNTSFEEAGGSTALYDLIYDVGARTSWVNTYIGQAQFKETFSFEPCGYCKEQFGYDAVAMDPIVEELHDYLSVVDINNPPKQEVLQHFEPIHRALRSLNWSVINKIETIELRMESIEHSLL